MARITAISTATPDLDFEASYRHWAMRQVAGRREERVYERMAERSGIEHRWSVLPPEDIELGTGDGFYGEGDPPGTAARMKIYERAAPDLAMKAIAGLGPKLGELGAITHIVVASCTGFVAPGIDQIIARRLGLASNVERVLVGFMGCYAAVTALRTARHIARSESDARILVVTIELCTLHHQDETEIEPLLASAQFGDGAAAAIVTSAPEAGLEFGEGISAALEDSGELITWHIGDTGFRMKLSGEVPGRIAAALRDDSLRDAITGGMPAREIEGWAIHAGGRSILDAVEKGFGLPDDALAASRAVLRDFGNMSSSTLMFVLRSMLQRRPASGIALAFGPGLAVEGFRFGWADAG